MWVLNTAGMAIIFALVRSTTSTASGQRWAAKPYANPGGYARPATRPNVHAPPIHKRPHSVSTSRGPQSLSSPHPHRPEHYQPMTAPYQPGTEENPVSLAMTGDMIEDNLMASKQDQMNIPQPPHTGATSMISGQHSLPDSTDDHPEHHPQPLPVVINNQTPPVVINQLDQTNIHQPPHTGDHPEHHPLPLTVVIDNQTPPVVINQLDQTHIQQPPHTGVTSIMSGQPSLPSEAASKEPPMTPARTEEIAIMQELTNAIESNEVVTEEMSEHDEMISTLTIHKFKEVLHEIVKDAVDKIVMKKAGIVGKLITAKQNLIGHDGEVTGTEFQAMDTCLCDQDLFDRRGRGDCNSRSLDFNGRKWCFLETFSFCHDEVASRQFPGRFWSHDACL